MNLSRAYTLTYGDELSVGRVQTPTLAMVVDRELAVRRFVAEDFLEVVLSPCHFGRKEKLNYSVRALIQKFGGAAFANILLTIH